MLDIESALQLIESQATHPRSEPVALPASVGRVLAQDVYSDVDSPPFDKSLMDGFAIRLEDLQKGCRKFRIVKRILAGDPGASAVVDGSAIQIMTGAPIPSGANCVVMIEQTRSLEIDGEWFVELPEDFRAKPHSNILGRAVNLRRGERVFDRGHRIKPHDLGLLAEIGCALPEVFRRPSFAVLATGNELVDCARIPNHSQIRNSNGPMLVALASQLSDRVLDLGVAQDETSDLQEKIEHGLDEDVLVLSGGVSAGLADLVPGALVGCGVQPIFHQVAIKPGKPIWFGVLKRHGKTTFVFGLPGNPVSTLVCFHVFVRGLWQVLMGSKSSKRSMQTAQLVADHSVRGPRPTYWPMACTVSPESYIQARALDWHGSSDLRCLGDANALGYFPPSETPYLANSSVPFFWLDQA